jgi:hypothetical protein
MDRIALPLVHHNSFVPQTQERGIGPGNLRQGESRMKRTSQIVTFPSGGHGRGDHRYPTTGVLEEEGDWITENGRVHKGIVRDRRSARAEQDSSSRPALPAGGTPAPVLAAAPKATSSVPSPTGPLPAVGVEFSLGLVGANFKAARERSGFRACFANQVAVVGAIEMGPDLIGSWHWAVSKGIGIIPFACSREEMLRQHHARQYGPMLLVLHNGFLSLSETVETGKPLSSVPDGYEIYEKTNGQVCCRRRRPVLISDKEVEIIKKELASVPLVDCIVIRKGKDLTVYESEGSIK